jgi:hypothetical protein
MRHCHLFLAACLLLSTLLAGCSGEKNNQVHVPEKAPVPREALAIRDVGVPGLAYEFSWPQEPSYTVHYIPEPRFTITFDRPLAATQQVRPFYIQWGRYVDIYPEGSEDPFYGGPAGDTFQISGNELSIRAPHGGLPMGTVLVVIPKGWRAADGSALEEEQSFLVSQGALAPHQVVSELVDSHGTAVDPPIWLPRSHAGPRIGYTIADGTPVASTHGGQPSVTSSKPTASCWRAKSVMAGSGLPTTPGHPRPSRSRSPGQRPCTSNDNWPRHMLAGFPRHGFVNCRLLPPLAPWRS